jgi:hypothetical protein
MAIQEGYNRYQCDVGGCSKSGYYAPNSRGASGYVTKTYLDSNGQTRTYVLCTDHAAQFVTLLQAHDAEVDAFIADGTMPTTTTESDA